MLWKRDYKDLKTLVRELKKVKIYDVSSDQVLAEKQEQVSEMIS